jgi:beta-lactam-binding protein with PASTA domain
MLFSVPKDFLSIFGLTKKNPSSSNFTMAQIKTQTKTDVYLHIGIILSLLLALFLGFFFLYLPASTNHGETITVPNLKGMTTQELETYLDDRNLDFEISDCTFIVGSKPLTVLSQYPLDGSLVKEGRKIYITISALNAPQIQMPKLVDRSLQSAEQILKSFGLEKGELKYVPDLAEGQVLKQLFNGKEIAAGTSIAKGSKIDLVVGDGLGNQMFEIPDLLGKTLEEATLTIVGSELVMGTIMYDPSSDQPAGTVIGQNPAAEPGEKIRMGSTIDIKIAGPAPDSAPKTEDQKL